MNKTVQTTGFEKEEKGGKESFRSYKMIHKKIKVGILN